MNTRPGSQEDLTRHKLQKNGSARFSLGNVLSLPPNHRHPQVPPPSRAGDLLQNDIQEKDTQIQRGMKCNQIHQHNTETAR